MSGMHEVGVSTSLVRLGVLLQVVLSVFSALQASDCTACLNSAAKPLLACMGIAAYAVVLMAMPWLKPRTILWLLCLAWFTHTLLVVEMAAQGYWCILCIATALVALLLVLSFRPVQAVALCTVTVFGVVC